ncbi:hypothetical protein [Streptomyces zaomyceticus]|uniref:hypothetical protein n=1 Tax=Streptomyces zaomyceticus TaxID=68286 RepID=UPI0036C9FFD6
MQRSTLKRRLAAATLAVTSAVGVITTGVSSASAATATVGLWLCAGGAYSVELNGRFLLDPTPNGAVGATFESGAVHPGADCYKRSVPFGSKLRINVRVSNPPPIMESYTIKTFEYIADQGMVIKAVGTLSAPDIERHRRNI